MASPVLSRRAIPLWRLAVQLLSLGLCLLIGWEFLSFYRQAVSDGPLTALRPPGVEGFLPISALLGFRAFLATGEWDMVHPAGLTFFVSLLASALVFRRVFCSWVCPVGTLSRLLEWGNGKVPALKKAKAPRRWAGAVLLSPKYLLLGAVLWVFGSMPIPAVKEFLGQPYNLAVDANMLRMFANLSFKGWLVFGGLAAFSLVVANGWCRFLCPYGALLSVASLASPFRIGRASEKCTGCGKCSRACGVGIEVAKREAVKSPECTMCQSCVAACPEEGALGVASWFGRGVSPWLVIAGGVGVLLAAYALARATGHWDSALKPEDFRYFYRLTLGK